MGAGFDILNKRLLVISPHLDDAALSIGAFLAHALEGARIEVVTLFAGLPVGQLSDVAQAFLDKCGLPLHGSAMAVRRNEDAAAMAALGVCWSHDDFLDAIFRKLKGGSWLCTHERSMFERDLPSEEKFVDALVRRVGDLCNALSPDIVLTCAGIGGHVDHLLTRDAVLQVTRAQCITTLLWEDLPYAANTTAFYPEFPGIARCFPACHESWARKWKAIACYPSQVQMLWGDTNWVQLMYQHAISRNRLEKPIEMLWVQNETDA